MSAFKFIGYYDLLYHRVYAKKDKIDINNLFSIYYDKNKHNYLFLRDGIVQIVGDQDRKKIEIYVMQNDVDKQEKAVKVGVTVAGLSLIALLKWAISIGDAKDVLPVKERPYVASEIAQNKIVLTDVGVKNYFVDMLNKAEVNVSNADYRILYYLYYVTYLEIGDGDDFINHLLDRRSKNIYASYQDLRLYTMTGIFNYAHILKTPLNDSRMVTYENMDIFLELNMLMLEETQVGNLDIEVYDDYIKKFAYALKERDRDIYRVWAYQREHNSMIGSLINLKIRAYVKSLGQKY